MHSSQRISDENHSLPNVPCICVATSSKPRNILSLEIFVKLNYDYRCIKI